jgi:dihydrolipoamide dehydrogenase
VLLPTEAFWRLRKQFQKWLTKRGLKFKLNTKVLSAEKMEGEVVVMTEAAEDGKQETVRSTHILLFLAGT